MTGSKTGIFAFRGIGDFKKAINSQGISIPVIDDYGSHLHYFSENETICGSIVPNRFCIQPMEGCDGEPDGSPGPLTLRRYKRFARGGAGMIWVEATAVTPEGKANPRQLCINDNSAENFKRLADMIRENSRNSKGENQKPFLVLQLTHSGRYSKPGGKAAPLIFHHSPILDPPHKLSADYPLVTDEYLDALQEKFLSAAKLAFECGFDAIDIKSCHGYLLQEILTAHTRTDSKYGGAFENRIRFITEVAAKIKREVPGLIITTRLNVYDAYPYPYGWGMKKDGSIKPDLSEPLELISRLKALGVPMVNITFGNPYYNPHIGRPYDYPIQGFSLPAERPLKIIERNVGLTKEIAMKHPDIKIVSVGFTWLRELFPHVCSAMLENKYCSFIGLGRQSFANPDFINEFFKYGKVIPEKTCITCSSCTQIMRDGGKSGCVIRDPEVYAPIYYQGRLSSEAFVRGLAESCRNCWGASCKGNCPAGIDVPGFINAFYEGDIRKSYDILRDRNVLSETCAYTCPAEVLCEKSCTSGILSKKNVPIHEIQRFVAAKARENGWTKVAADAANDKKIVAYADNAKKVAVIGFGPAGIACTAKLIEKGIKVKVFEASNIIGGTATAVIPYERLLENVFEEEVRAMGLKETGLFDIRYNCPINHEFSLDKLLLEDFDAVFISAGLCENTGLPVSAKPEGVYQALDFLYDIKRGAIKPEPGEKAAVIGGGNTAMDAAISLKHAGVRDVYLIYRRSFMELPAWQGETDKALKAGVHFIILNQPLSYSENNGKLTGIKMVHTQLGDEDASGRPAPVVIPGTEYVFPVTMCVEATGQKVSNDLAGSLQGVEFEKGRIKTIDGLYMTTRKNVFAGGDIVNGGQTVVQAVKEGMEAAEQIAESIYKV